MPRRRRLLIFTAAAALLLAASYVYWAWDPVDVTRYVPRDSIIILEIEDLAGGLNNIGYGEIAGRLPEPVRQNALLPYRSLGPGIDAMDIIGTRCIIFMPVSGAGTMPRGAVMAARISQKAKFAETVASIIGKTHKKKTKAGRNVRMVQPEGLDDPIFYARMDRILVASDSIDSLDAVIGTPPSGSTAARGDHPCVTLRIGKEGFTAISQWLRSHKEYRQAESIIRNLADKINYMMELEASVSLIENPEFAGHFALYMGGLFESMYRETCKSYIPKGFDAVPGRISAAISTNDPGIAEKVKIGTDGLNRVFHEVSDFFQDLGTHDDNLKTFSGELTIAATSIGEETAGFLFVSTRKILFPQAVISRFLSRLRAKTVETSYVGKEKGGEVYRVRSAGANAPVYLWIARNTIVLCSSENAFRAFVAKLSADPGGGPTFEKGDLFLVVDPPTDPEAFLKMIPIWDNRYRFLLDTVGPIYFQATSSGGKIRFSGNVTMRHDEGS